jgi:hypothetical protein
MAKRDGGGGRTEIWKRRRDQGPKTTTERTSESNKNDCLERWFRDNFGRRVSENSIEISVMINKCGLDAVSSFNFIYIVIFVLSAQNECFFNGA